MKPTEKIERLIKQTKYSADAATRKRILDDAQAAMAKQQATASTKPAIWRIIMKSPITKFAAAAVIIIAVLIGINHFGGKIDVATVAWANVTKRIAQVNYVHFYQLKSSDDGFEATDEGWFAHGKTFSRGDSGYTYYDDGQKKMGFDKHKTLSVVHVSDFTGGKSFIEALSGGLLSLENEQFEKQIPTEVGDDFLIYNFAPTAEDAKWLDHISVTVGRNSLLPIQIKTYEKPCDGKGGEYSLVMLDYDEPEKPLTFFEPPQKSEPPHGWGRVVLDGNEVVIDINNAPGIKKAIVRLHDKYDGPSSGVTLPLRDRYEMAGKPVYRLQITFITDERLRSTTSSGVYLWLNEGQKCGLGADNWADGKYRNIRYTPVLRPTSQPNEFIVEISCWLRTK